MNVSFVVHQARVSPPSYTAGTRDRLSSSRRPRRAQRDRWDAKSEGAEFRWIRRRALASRAVGVRVPAATRASSRSISQSITSPCPSIAHKWIALCPLTFTTSTGTSSSSTSHLTVAPTLRAAPRRIPACVLDVSSARRVDARPDARPEQRVAPPPVRSSRVNAPETHEEPRDGVVPAPYRQVERRVAVVGGGVRVARGNEPRAFPAAPLRAARCRDPRAVLAARCVHEDVSRATSHKTRPGARRRRTQCSAPEAGRVGVSAGSNAPAEKAARHAASGRPSPLVCVWRSGGGAWKSHPRKRH